MLAYIPYMDPMGYHHHFLWLFYPQYWLTSGRNARITLTSSRFLADAQDTHLGSAGSASTKNFRSTQTGRNWAEAIAMHWRKMMTWYIVNVKKHILVGGVNGKIWENMGTYYNIYIWLVVSTYPSEKYVFVSWDDDIPNWMESHKIHFPNHQPELYLYLVDN